ncbi:hypothetical protein JCM8097_003473 [Rhodosporidiobolus ruineniae]
MLDGLLEALFAPVNASFTRLLQPSTSLPEFRTLLVLLLMLVCLALIIGNSICAVKERSPRAGADAALWFAAAVALAGGLVCTVPAESSDFAYAFHAVFKFFTTFTSWPLAVAYFLYRSVVIVIEAILATCFALVAAVLPAVLLFMLCNFCVWTAVGCAFATWTVFVVFCSSVQQRYSLSPPRIPNPADAAHLAAIPASDEARTLQRIWLSWITTQADDQVLWLARRLTTATTDQHLSSKVQPLPPVEGFDGKYTLWAAEAIVPHARAEHLLRYDYSQTIVDKLVLFFHHLSGCLLQTFLPLPSLRDRFRPFEADLLEGVLFSPFATISMLRHPDNWTRRGMEGVRHIEPATSPALEELLTTAVQFLHGAFGTRPLMADRESAKQQLSTVLDEAATRMRAERADRYLPDAVLDAVLLWKARKEGR